MSDPKRVLRQSPSGPKLGVYGYARLSMSGTAAYTDGVSLQVPFDQIDQMSEGFGAIVAAGGVLLTPGAFRLTDTGLYLINTFAVLSDGGTASALAIAAGGTVVGGQGSGANIDAISGVGNAIVSDLTAQNGDISTILTVTGASGTLLSATCLILQIN